MHVTKEKQTMSLQKGSSPEHVKTYFKKVFELKKSGKEFPVNLDEVWPLVYKYKKGAVEALKNDFFEGIDYQAMPNNRQRGAASSIDYYITVSCLEFFIVRKLRPVFEVYRKVFHAAVEGIKYNHILDQNWISIESYCREFNSTVHSFYGLYSHYRTEFLYLKGFWYMSEDLAKQQQLRQRFEDNKKVLRKKSIDSMQLNLWKGGQQC
jgi:hypothetical protein